MRQKHDVLMPFVLTDIFMPESGSSFLFICPTRFLILCLLFSHSCENSVCVSGRGASACLQMSRGRRAADGRHSPLTATGTERADREAKEEEKGKGKRWSM